MIKVVKDPKNPERTEVLAEAIIRMSESMKKLEESGINRKGIVALIADDTKLAKGTIEVVIDSIQQLSAWYCKKES